MYITECPKCKTKINDKSNYCHKCGAKLNEYTHDTNINYPINKSEYKKASSGLRFIAYLLDSVIILILSIPSFIFIITGIVTNFNNGNCIYEYNEFNLQNLNTFILGLILLIFPLIYEFIKDGLGKGQSLGKRAVGLMVVNINDNTPCSIASSILRKIVWTAISLFPAFGWLVEPIMILATEDGRRLGDLAAGTMVIEKRYYNANNI